MTKKTLNLIILGPPGAGKGTQAKLLKDKFALEHIEPGDMLRTLAESKSSLAKGIRRLMINGQLVPTKLLLQMVRLRIQSLPKDQGIIFDGTPRRLIEAKQLELMLETLNRRLTHIFYLKVSKREVKKRLSKRAVCKKCDQPLIIGKDIKSLNDSCPKCGGKVFQREDDTPQGIKKRWQTFLKETKPVIDYYRKQNRLIEINGEQSINKVQQDIKQNRC